ncbi:MAG TPA: SDR family NAD(P)-dependent oxidoreductase, partial [Acidimicrobiales bacterium]
MSTSDELTGTVALVTGASSGIGEATALALAQKGATVAIAARRKDRLDQLARRITDEGGRALAIEADVGEREQAEALVQRTVDELGRLDTGVTCASRSSSPARSTPSCESTT